MAGFFLPQPHARPFAIFLDEDHASRFKGGVHRAIASIGALVKDGCQRAP